MFSPTISTFLFFFFFLHSTPQICAFTDSDDVYCLQSAWYYTSRMLSLASCPVTNQTHTLFTPFTFKLWLTEPFYPT